MGSLVKVLQVPLQGPRECPFGGLTEEDCLTCCQVAVDSVGAARQVV